MVIIKALILAAGYATRLYPLTQNQSKPLLEVGSRTILQHLLDKVAALPEVSDIMIVTNHRFYDQFRIWVNHHPYKKPIKILDDGTLSNDDRLGAVGDIHFALKEEDINDHLLVIAGDNLFGFSLKDFATFFSSHQSTIVALHDFKDKEKIKGKYGVAILEKTKLIDFEEKPMQPKSTLASTACYIFHKDDLSFIEKSIDSKKADNLGDLIRFLVKNSKVHGFVFREHWFDIGSFESLQEAEKALASSRKTAS